MSAQYQRFIKVLEKWPAEKTKVGRDLGEQIRKQVTKLTDASSHNIETTAQLTKQIDALERISNNIYAKKYPRRYESTATGLTAAQCSQVLSSEFLQYLNDGAAKRN
ncbi:ubiquinol-cytochrome-c reductase complex assembly factor 2 isoform X2 [Drosophila montana]|uniref:ubiquinol-cytochrome-c reductase complex assembly factor 2 isoform X2 n=1 Tax=Drosophila montana TaxID=40370 RepID=UPI00313ECECB